MAERITRQLIAEKAIVHAAPVLPEPKKTDRGFELPSGLYIAMATLFFGFVGVMASGFSSPAMIIPTAIIVIFVAVFFAVPTLWARMKPDNPQRPLSWQRFTAKGIMTATGHSEAGAATVQVLILPALIFLWGVAVVTVAALVR